MGQQEFHCGKNLKYQIYLLLKILIAAQKVVNIITIPEVMPA